MAILKPLTIVADQNIPQVKTLFAALGEVHCVAGRELNQGKHRDLLLRADILLVRSVTEVNERLLTDTPVKLVATATIGTDHLDTDYLESRGIHWTAAPGSNADSVVDYVICAFNRLPGIMKLLMAEGTVGIVGMGNVGGRLYQRLKTLGINCRVCDPLIDQRSCVDLCSLDEIMTADVICLHTPLTYEGDYPSYHLFNAGRLAALKTGAVLLNAGRGAVVDNQALKQLLEERDDLCTVLDVWEHEPDVDIDLLKRVDLATPHIAGYSLDGKLRGAQMIFQRCCELFKVDNHAANTTAQGGVEGAVARYEMTPDLKEISLRITGDPLTAIKRAVRACYDVAEDDQRMRGALLHPDITDNSGERGQAFDQLRKNYPVRREFSTCRIINAAELDSSVVSALVALGFLCD